MNVEHLRCDAENITKKGKQEYHYFYMHGSHCTTVPYFRENKFPVCFNGIVRSIIYIGLYIGWAISIHKRVVQKSVKNTLLLISGLMIFWFIIRTVKYFFTIDANIERYLWYSYYLPMLFIPQAALQAAILLGQPEEYTLPKWSKLIYLPAIFCFLLA